MLMTSHMEAPDPPFLSPPLLTLLSLAPGESVVKCLERTAINGWPEKAAAAAAAVERQAEAVVSLSRLHCCRNCD